ncbi:MAG: LON peptidase substrate-binding domain-containing protein, partial [bacterium]
MDFNASKGGSSGPPLPEIPKRLRVLAFGDGVLFPYMVIPVVINAEHLKKLIEEAVSYDNLVGVFAIKGEAQQEKLPELYDIGTAAMILRMLRMPDGSLQVVLQGLKRVARKEFVQLQPFMMAEVQPLEETLARNMEFEGLLKNTITQFHEIVRLAPYLSNEAALVVNNLDNPS